jgi:hypothetical protein
VIVPMMGTRFDLLYAASMYGRVIPFCLDVWEPAWQSWIRALERIRPPLVIVTSLDSAIHLGKALDDTRVEFLPEAANVHAYRAGDALAHRPIDILELGRRNHPWHDAVTPRAEALGWKHLYEQRPGELVFPDEATLVTGLSASKLSVCFPSSVTHPERAGSVCTMTHRYLESLASRCLIVGRTPPELPALLGFDPVVPADTADPVSQLHLLLDSVESFQEMVDQARAQLLTVGDWTTRARDLLALVRDL